MESATSHPRKTKLRIFEHDTSKPLQPGKNPLPILEAEIDYERRIPRRERAAVAKVAELCGGRRGSVAHATNGDVVVTLEIKPTGGK